MSGGWRALGLAVAIAASGCGSLHIRAVNEGSSGPLYDCDDVRCKPAQTDDPSRTNLGRMDTYELPDGCIALSRAVVRREGPMLDVVCGQPGSETSHRCERGRACRQLAVLPDPRDSDIDLDVPAECGGRIHELVVVDAAKPTTHAFIECDASSGPIEEM